MPICYYYRRICWLTLGLMMFGINGQAQSQKQKYIRGLIESIAQYQIYISRLKKGYDIVKKGLNIVRDIRNGELSFHKDYFSSLEQVNPSIRNYTKITAIIAFQYEIIKRAGKLKAAIENRQFVGKNQLSYVYAVMNQLLEETSANISEFTLITTNGKVKMTDDERIRRIDALYERSAKDYSFMMTFSNQLQSVLYGKQKDLEDTKIMKELYGNHK